jgi:hypothetical protein
MYQLLKQDLTEVDIVIPEDFEQKEINAIATPKIKSEFDTVYPPLK